MMRNNNNPRGFTLVELLITIAVLGIVLTVGVPSYQSYTANQRARTAAQDLFMGLTLARSEAIKRNAEVSVIPAASGNWADGWAIRLGAQTYSECLAGASGCLRVKQRDGNITVVSAAPNVTFRRSGRVAGGGNPSFGICDSSNLATERRVKIELSGRPALTHAGQCS